MKLTILGLFACCLTYGQTPNPLLPSEVASVKLSLRTRRIALCSKRGGRERREVILGGFVCDLLKQF
jgi:hypothetical protein